MPPFWKHPLILDPALGWLLGTVLLAPISFSIGNAELFPKEQVMGIAFSPVAVYLDCVCLFAGMACGWLRRRAQLHDARQQELLLEKETLLRILSHDVAGSLDAARALTETAARDGDSSLSPRSGESLMAARRTLENSSRLIDFTRRLMDMDNGRWVICLVPADMAALAAECATLHELQAREMDLLLTRTFAPGPCEALVEPVGFLNCVLGALVGNAIKYSIPGGEVRIEGKPHPRGYQLEVVNRGPDISAEAARSLQNLSGQRDPGLGLGLSLAARFTRLMGGELSVRSWPLGGGAYDTVFRVVLPAPQAQKAISPVAEQGVQPPRLDLARA
ncbi:MAG: sensor histidine kinase [Acidobacteriota bacterium]